jgi:hypothetical protein
VVVSARSYHRVLHPLVFHVPQTSEHECTRQALPLKSGTGAHGVELSKPGDRVYRAGRVRRNCPEGETATKSESSLPSDRLIVRLTSLIDISSGSDGPPNDSLCAPAR